MSHSYQDLRVWQKGVDLVEEVYKLTERFPKKEMFGLAAQLERSATSVPSNIAEGQGRATRRDFRHFLATARGSLFEMETQVIIANRLGYVSKGELDDLLRDSAVVNSMLNGLIQSMGEDAASAG